MSAYATLRHVTASGRLDAFWEYDPARRALILRVAVGRFPVHIDDLAVCSPKRPRRLAWVLIRRDADSWILSAARMPNELETRIAHAEAFHRDLPVGSIALTSAPAHVAAELEAL